MDINHIIKKLLIKYPTFGHIIANTSIIENNGIDTACTDGEIIYYNQDFLNKLNEKEQIFIFAHEVSHIALDHIYRSEGRDQEVWNIATDAVINANLICDGLSLPKIGGVDIPEAIHYNAEEMYDKLLKEKKQFEDLIKKFGKDIARQMMRGKGIAIPSDQKGHASHGIWKQVIDNKNKSNNTSNKENAKNSKNNLKSSSNSNDNCPSNSKNKANSQSGKNNLSSESQNNDKETKKNEINEFAKKGEKEVFKQNRVERKKQLEELRQSLINSSCSYGNEAGNNIRTISDIGVSKPLIDWRLLLRESINMKVDWSYKNATIEEGVLTPHLEEEMVPTVEIVLDTSGSIDENLLKNFLRECKNILQTSIIKVGCFDTKFYGFTRVRKLSDIDNLQYPGGGGTDFDVAVNAFSKRVDNKIIFTDGWARMPSKKVNAIWIVFGNREINPEGGKVIYINEEQLNKLCRYETSKVKKYK